MENNKTLLEALQSNVEATRKELSESIDRRNQYMKDAMLPSGDYAFNMAELAKEEAKAENLKLAHEKSKQALEKLMAEDEANGKQTSRMSTAIYNLEKQLSYANTVEEALQKLSAEDRLVFVAYPELLNRSQQKYVNKFHTDEASLSRAYTTEDYLEDQRGLFDRFWAGKDAVVDTVKRTGADILGMTPAFKATYDLGTLEDSAIKKGSDISRKLTAQQEFTELAKLYPHLSKHFLATKKANELTVDDYAFLNSAEGQQYISGVTNLKTAQEVSTIDTPLTLQLNQRSLNNTVGDVANNFKLKSVGSAFWESAKSLTTEIPEIMVESIRSLGSTLLLSNPTTMSTGVASLFGRNLTESLTELRAQGKGLDEINYAKVSALGFLAATVDAMGDRLLSAGLRKAANSMPGDLLTKQSKRYNDLVDDFVAKGLTTEQAANAAMKIVAPETVGKAYKIFTEAKDFAKKSLSETAQKLPGYDSTLGRALRKSGGATLDVVDKVTSFGSRYGFSPKDLAKEAIGEGLAEATGGALQNIAQEKEVTTEGFLKEALLGGLVGLGMQGPMGVTAIGRAGINKLGARKYLSDKEFSSNIDAIQNIMESTDYDNYDNVREALEKTTELKSKTEDHLKEVNSKLSDYTSAVTQILKDNNISTSLVTESGQLIKPENSGLSGKDLKQYTKIYNDSQKLFKLKDTLEARSAKLDELSDSLNYTKAGKGHSREFSKVEQLANLQMAEDQATINRAKDFDALSEDNKIKYLQEYEGMTKNQARDYVDNLDTDYTAQNIIDNAGATGTVDAQKLQENIDYYGIDANHLNQIKNVDVLKALADITDDQATVDHYNEVIKNAKLQDHKDLYRRVSTAKESANTRSEAIKRAKFNVFDKKLGKPTTGSLNAKITALQSDLDNNVQVTQDMADLMGYIEYGDSTERDNFYNGLSTTGKAVYDQNISDLESDVKLTSLETHYNQYHNRHTKLFDTEAEARKAVGNNRMLLVKEDPYATGKWVVRSQQQDILEARDAGIIHDGASLQKYLKDNKVALISKDDSKLIADELSKGKSYEDVLEFYEDSLIETFHRAMPTISTRVKQAMGVLGYNPKSLKRASFSSNVRNVRKVKEAIKKAKEEEKETIEKENADIDAKAKEAFGFNESFYTKLKTKKLLAEEAKEMVTDTKNWIWSNLGTRSPKQQGNKITVSRTFATQIKAMASLYETEYYQKAKKADSASSMKSNILLNMEMTEAKEIAVLAHSIAGLIDKGAIGIDDNATALVIPSDNFTIDRHIYIKYENGKISSIEQDFSEPIVDKPLIKTLNVGEDYSKADSYGKAEAEKLFYILIDNSDGLGNTGSMTDAGRLTGLVVHDKPTETKNSPALQEDLFGTTQNTTTYLQNNVIKDLDSTNSTVRDNAIKQLQGTVKWFWNTINNTTSWKHTSLGINSFSEANFTANNNLDYFANELGGEKLREFEALVKALEGNDYKAISESQAIKELINNPNKFNKVFDLMNTPLGVMLLGLATPMNNNKNPENSFDSLKFNDNALSGINSIDKVYNQCGDDPLTRNIVFNSIIRNTQLFAKISHNVNAGGAGNISVIESAGKPLRNLLNEAKSSGEVKVRVEGSTESVSTQDNFHVVSYDGQKITEAYTLPASVIFQLGYHTKYVIYTDKGERLTDAAEDIEAIHSSNKEGKSELLTAINNVLTGNSGNVAKDFLMIDFLLNSVTKNPKLNTKLLSGTKPLAIKWKYWHYAKKGDKIVSSNRPSIMTFAATLDSALQSIQQEYTFTEFNTHEEINTTVNGNLRNFSLPEVRNQLNALASYLESKLAKDGTTTANNITVEGVLIGKNTDEYYRTHEGDLKQALVDVDIWTKERDFDGKISPQNIRDLVKKLNKSSKTSLTPQEHLVVNFLIEYGSLQGTFKNSNNVSGLDTNVPLDRRNAKVNNPEFLNYLDTTVKNNEDLNSNFTANTKKGSVYQIPNIIDALSRGISYPGITNTLEGRLLANIAPLIQQANIEASTYLNGTETGYNADSLLRLLMKEQNGSWFLPDNIFNTGIAAVFGSMPNMNTTQSEEFKNKLAITLASANPQVRMRINATLEQTKGTYSEELINQVAIAIKKALSPILTPKDSAINPDILYKELAATAIETLSKAGYLKKTLIRTDPTAPDAGSVITDPKDTKGCMVIYSANTEGKANAVVTAVRNCVQLTSDGRTVHGIYDFFGMENPSRNNFTATDNDTTITEKNGNEQKHKEFNAAWDKPDYRTNFGRTMLNDNDKIVVKYFEEDPRGHSDIHKWCQVNIGDDSNEHWVTVPITALYSDRPTGTRATVLGVKANATQYLQPQQINMTLTKQIFGDHLDGFGVRPDGTVYHVSDPTFPCGIRLDLHATQQPKEFYKFFGLEDAYKKYKYAGSSTQKAEAEEALNAHYNNIMDYLRFIVSQKKVWNSLDKTTRGDFDTWLAKRKFHFHLKNSVNARVMYDSVFNPRDGSDIRLFFTTVRSKVSAEALTGKSLNDLTSTEKTMLKNSVIRGRNLILASSLGISWDKSTDDFISENSKSPMTKFYNDVVEEMKKDANLKQYFSNNPPKDPPSIEVIKEFVENRLNGKVSITVPTFDAESRDYTKSKELKEFTVNAGLVQFISEVCTSDSHLDGSLNGKDMFYIRGEIDGITNGTSLLLGKANKLSNALRNDTAELWNKVGISLSNMTLFDIKKRQAQLGLGADAYLMQLLVTDSDIVDIIHTLENEQQTSGNDSNAKKYILEILASAFETNKDLAPQLTRDLMKTQAMPYNYLAGRASRQQKLLESLCTEFNHTIQKAIAEGDEAKARELLRKFAKLNNGSITLHNYATSETRLLTEDQITTISVVDLKQLSIDFANVANQKIVETINVEAAAKFVEAPGVKLAEIAEKEGMGKLANACDTLTSLLLAELIEEYNTHNGVISNSARERIVERYLRCFPGPGGSLNALSQQGISVNKINFKHAINEFIDSIFVPVKGGGITIRTSYGLPTSRGAGNVPMQVHMLDGTVVQDAIVHLGVQMYNLMIHDAIEGGVGTLFSSSKRMNQTHAYITLTENPWNTAVSMIEHAVEDIKGTMATGALSSDIFQKAADIHNITHPNQPPVQKDFAEKILMELKAKSLESLIDKLNVLNELKQDNNKNLTFNQYYGGKDSAFTLGLDDFEYIDRNGNPQKIEYKDRNTYFDDITKVMIEKYEETQRLNTSAFSLINHIKYLTSNREDNPYPHIIYALVAEPGKVGKAATANLNLSEYIRVNNLRNTQDLLDALDPEKGRLAQNYYNWLFNTPGVKSATADIAWESYKQEYNLLKEATISRKSDQNLYNFVTHMVNARLPNSNAIGDRSDTDLEYNRAKTREELKNVLTAHINSTNPYAANFAAYYLNTLTEYGIVKPSVINEKFTHNINAQMLIQTKSTTNDSNKVLTGLLSVVASYKDTDQNSKELNYILNNISDVFPKETSDAISRLVPYDNSTDVTRIHIPTGEFDMEEWEAGFLEAEKEALASTSYKGNVYFDQVTGKQYSKTSDKFANARKQFRQKYFTTKINQIVQQIINRNKSILGNPNTKVQLVVEGNSYLGAMVATALAHHSFNLTETAGNRDNIQVAVLPIEATPEKLEENWTLGIINAVNPASTENPRDSVTIIAPQGSKPDPVLESIAHFYNPKASKLKGTSKSLTIPKWDIQGNKVHVGSPEGHNSGKMMSPGLQTQAIVLSKAGEFLKNIDSALLGTTSMTYQNYLDSKSLNDIPFFKADNTLEWEDGYNPNTAFKATPFNVGEETISPYSTLGIHINTAKLIQTGILEGADASSQIALNKIKNNVDMPSIAKKLRDTMVGKSKAQTQGISLFNHSVKLGPSIVNIGFVPSNDFIAIPKRLLANLSKNTNTNEYFLGEHKISKEQYDTLFRIRANNKYLNATNPESHIPNFITTKNNQVIVVSNKDLGGLLPQSVVDELQNENNFFTTLSNNIENRAYKSLDVYVNRIKNHREGTGNTSVILFKDTGTVTAKGNFVGSYSIANLENATHSDVTEFWEGVTPITDITSQAHREYSSYTSGAEIATKGKTTLGNNIRALQDDSLADLPQALYGVGDLKKLFDHPVLSSTNQDNPILERTIDAILDTDIQVMIGVENTLNRNNTPLAITGIDAHTGRQFINISMQNVGSNIAENNREALAHELTHRVVAEGLKNENLLRQVRVLYEYVKANITEDDFQCDYATRREIMDYVFPKNRSNVNVLQEFLAYALTNKHLIDAIANMSVDAATIEALNARTSGLFNKICGFVSDSAINRMDEPSVQRNICQLFADMAKIAKKNWTRPEERLKYADPSFGMQYADISKHPDLDATRGIPVGDKALLGAIEFDYKQAQGSYDEFIRYISRDDYSEEHLGNSAYTPESIGLTRWIENCCKKFSDNLYGFMNMLVPIMGGTTESNQIYTKAALQLKVRVDQMRERLITAGTKYMRGLFDTCEIGDDSQISQDRRRAITDTILDTDFKALLEMYSYNDIKDMVANPKKLNQEIQKLLNYPVIQKSATYYSNACKGLANRMVHGVDTSRLGLRNAYQIFNKWGSNNSTTSHYSADGVKQIDTLVTLYAIQVLSPESKERLLDLMELPKGEQLINGITSMHKQLMLKQERDIFSNDNNVYNIPKGWTHRLKDSDKSLQLIPRSSLEMYEYQGYEYITDAVVPPEVKRIFPKESDLVYVKHQHILNTPYVPGIAPVTRKIQQPGEQYTINLLGTGRLDLTVDPDLRPMEFKKLHGIHNNQTKLMSMKQSDHPITEYDTLLEPIFNTMGKIIGYNLRPNDKTLAKFTKEDTEADHIFGTTLGNIAERHITPQLNQKTAENLATIYEKSKHKDRDFKWIGLNDPDEEVQLAYKMLPADIRDYFQELYPGKGVPIEKQYFARIVGHKPLSAGDTQALEKYYNSAINAPMDYIKKAFHSKYAVAGEYWAKQMADIGKQALVIQSGTVTLYNWISNLMLLNMRGVSLQDAIRLQYKGWNQLQRYKELGQQIDDLKIKALVNPKIDISSKINSLQSEIENLDIYPLLKGGFYSSIASNEITSKDTLIDQALKSLPQEIRNTMGYKGIANLLAAKGTTVHKVLQDLAVDSDFVGRYALYTHLKDAQFTDPVTGHTTTMSEDKRLGIINDMFIDYTVPLPKPIEWAEKVGLYVFSKYMFRTQKNLYSILTSNWQEVGKLAIAQMMLGGGAMGSNPFQSLMLPGQVLSHFNTPGGLALDGLSGLPLVRLLN